MFCIQRIHGPRSVYDSKRSPQKRFFKCHSIYRQYGAESTQARSRLKVPITNLSPQRQPYEGPKTTCNPVALLNEHRHINWSASSLFPCCVVVDEVAGVRVRVSTHTYTLCKLVNPCSQGTAYAPRPSPCPSFRICI